MRSRLPDSFGDALLWLLATLALSLPLWMLASLWQDGAAGLSWSFLIGEPLDAGRSGGIGSLLASTALILFICLVVVISLGTGCALYLSEMVRPHSRQARYLGQALDVLAGTPSIVFGLFGYVFFAQVVGLGFSILAGGLSLACMVLPLYVRLAEQALRQTPESYRAAAQALALSQSGFALHILLPSAARPLSAALIIAAGRALAETAVLIFTAGYVTRMPHSVMDSGRALSVHIYDLAMNVPGGSTNAAATALVLLAVLILFNLSARWLGRAWEH